MCIIQEDTDNSTINHCILSIECNNILSFKKNLTKLNDDSELLYLTYVASINNNNEALELIISKQKYRNIHFQYYYVNLEYVKKLNDLFIKKNI
jgi:hypothetical protein